MKNDSKNKDLKNSITLSPNGIATNPIDKSGLVAKINVLGSGMSSIKTPHGIINHFSDIRVSTLWLF